MSLRFLPRLSSVEKILSITSASTDLLKFGSWHEGYRYVFGPLKRSRTIKKVKMSISSFPIFNSQYLVGGKPSLVVICSGVLIQARPVNPFVNL